MASIIPIDGEMWQRMRQERMRGTAVARPDTTPSIGQMLAIGQAVAPLVGGAADLAVKGIGAHMARSAWEEANQRYRDEQAAKQQAEAQPIVDAERANLVNQARQLSEDRAAAIQGPGDITQPLSHLIDRSREQTVAQFLGAPTQQVDGTEQFPPLDWEARKTALMQQRQDMSPPEMQVAEQVPMQRSTGQIGSGRANFAQMQPQLQDLPTVEQLHNMAFMAGQRNDPEEKQRVLDLMGRMGGSLGGAESLSDLVTGAHEQRGAKTVRDLMTMHAGKSPLEQMLEMERIKNLQSQETARAAKQKRDEELHAGNLRKQELDNELRDGRIDEQGYKTKLKRLLAEFEPERQDEMVKLWQAQAGQANANSVLAGVRANLAPRETRAKEVGAGAQASQARTAARRLELQRQGKEGVFADRSSTSRETPEEREQHRLRGKTEDQIAKTLDELNAAAERAGLPVLTQKELMKQGVFDKAALLALESQIKNQKDKADVKALSRSLEDHISRYRKLGGDPSLFVGSVAGDEPAGEKVTQPAPED